MTTSLQDQLQEILGSAYTLERELGGGGMSRVFVASDVELERKVVVKVLPPELAAAVSVERFRREIQLAARLQHPHIVPLLSAGAKGALLYYTMPFIEGESLRARLSRTRELPVHAAARVLREIADALAYAHERKVVHRDIKPENIMLSGNHALVTDFGVSKALATATTETVSPGASITSLGVALGTPAYMAPEQAAADPLVDHRADIYSLGVVGYELLTGRPPFVGQSPQQVLSAQITATPDDLTKHRANVSPALASIIMRCLEKNPADRWQTADEMLSALETAATPSGATQPAQAASPSRRAGNFFTPQRIAVLAGAAGVIVAGFILSTIAFRRNDAAWAIGATRMVTNSPGVEVHPVVSPDGKMIAYTVGLGQSARVFVQQITGGRAVPLAAERQRAILPSWASDGSRVAFVSRGSVYAIPALGGAPVPLVLGDDSTDIGQVVWSPDGTRLAFPEFRFNRGMSDGSSLIVSDVNGGNRRAVASATTPLHSPQWSPDGEALAYVQGNPAFLVGRLGNIAPSTIWIVSTEGGDPVRITDGKALAMSPVWTPDGDHLLFVSSHGGGRDIYMQRLGGGGTPRGDPVRLTTGLNPHSISASRDGRTLVYSVLSTTSNVWSIPIGATGQSVLTSARPLTTGNQTIENVDVTRDGLWLVYDSNIAGNQDIYRVSSAGGEPQRLTTDPADDFYGVWSADASELTFHTFRNGNRDIYTMAADGTRQIPAAATPDQERAPNWSPDGLAIVYSNDNGYCYVVRRASRDAKWGTPQRFVRGNRPRWSPDGKLIAYRAETVAPAGPPGPNRPIATVAVIPAQGGSPIILTASERAIHNAPESIRWSANSKVIYFATRPGTGGEIWSISAGGGTPTRVMSLTDPARQPYLPEFGVDAKNFYLVLGTRESDIGAMDLVRK